MGKGRIPSPKRKQFRGRMGNEWAVGVDSTADRQVLKSGRPVSLDPAGPLFAR